MEEYRKILKRKIDYYGYTEAAIEFAIEEYANMKINKIPTEKESELEADARYPTEKHLEDYNKGANDGWNECYEWIMEKIK